MTGGKVVRLPRGCFAYCTVARARQAIIPHVAQAAEYQPGHFCERELPGIL